jgi:hypothetical protein
LPERFDLRIEIVLDDRETRPDRVHQLGLGDDFVGLGEQAREQIEGAPSDRRRFSVKKDLPGVATQFDAAEFQIGAHEALVSRRRRSFGVRAVGSPGS